MLKPALSVALIFRTIQALLVFDVIYIMTGGGPGNSTETLLFLSYNTFIINTDFGEGGAMSIVLVILALAVSPSTSGYSARPMRRRAHDNRRRRRGATPPRTPCAAPGAPARRSCGKRCSTSRSSSWC